MLNHATPKISDRMEPVSPSAIRETFKFTSMPGMISFAGGNPNALTFPSAEFAALSAELMEKNPVGVLQYGISEGFGPLRELTKSRCREKFHIGAEDDDILLVSGGQQGIDLSLKCLTDEGDCVVSENPSFVGGLNAIRSYNVKLLGVPMDKDGMDTDALEHVLKTEKRVKLIYTIPDFQNPMGVCMSLARRRRLIELAERYGVTILEDSPYHELRYGGEALPSLKSLDSTGHVIYCGSYSKTVAPGLRVGYLILDGALAPKFTAAKQVTDVHTGNWPQMLIAEYLTRFDFDAHVEHCRDVYRVLRDAMVQGLTRNLAGCDSVRFTRPEGGLFIWVDLPGGKSGYKLFEALLGQKLAVVPGSAFDPAGKRDKSGVRLNFSMPTKEQIEQGTAIFGETVREFMA
ncbi:MAG: PLP-dependent aminotransferase family protein [Firmicutes bacterium]|nr:PLP-dependent aminotransferase family protein [Bacillota bacterium]